MIYSTIGELCHLNTVGEGTQNLMRILRMFSCSVFSSRHHDVCSLADAPAVGSGAPHTCPKEKNYFSWI